MSQQELHDTRRPNSQNVGFEVANFDDPILTTEEQEYLGDEYNSAKDLDDKVEAAALAGKLVTERLIAQQTTSSIETAKGHSEATKATLDRITTPLYGSIEFSPGLNVPFSDKEYNPSGRAAQQKFGKGLFQSRKLSAIRNGEEATVSYGRRRGSNEVVLEGFYISPDLRGRGKGVELVGLFMDRMREEKRKFTRTETIRKPGIAQTLEKTGFTLDPSDKSQGVHVLVLPKTPQEKAYEKATKVELPPVVFVRGARNSRMDKEQQAKQLRKELALALDPEMRTNKSGKEFFRIANDADSPGSIAEEYKDNFKQLTQRINAAATPEEKATITRSACTVLGKRWIPSKRKR